MANDDARQQFYRHRDNLPPELKKIAEKADDYVNACMEYFGSQAQEAQALYYIFQYAAASYAMRHDGISPEALMNALLFLTESTVRSFEEPEQTTVRLNVFYNFARSPSFELPGGAGMLSTMRPLDA